ncbi:MAG: UDP-N-acetylglucosamine 2-epimerase (non-hydrolyzing) [Pseudomonadota bacterium]
MKITAHLVAAARPNFMKIAPLYHALSATDWCEPKIVHTGQHYDFNMSDAFFQDLALPTPAFHLNIGSGSHAEQTGGVMIAYEQVCATEKPDWIIVVGDVNSTAACAMVGAKQWIPTAHLEAGLRSGDRRMPEEINRLVTDAIADVLWTPSADADENLLREGVDVAKIDMVGNIMIDSFELLRDKIDGSDARSRLGLESTRYSVVTLHRPSNVDHPDSLRTIVGELVRASDIMQLVFVAHPRTQKSLQNFDLMQTLEGAPNIAIVDPLSYVDFMNVLTGSNAAITDSGGLQEETTYLGIPCLTLRENTERPVTISMGTNRLVAIENLVTELEASQSATVSERKCPPLWDGQTASRVAESLRRYAS